jgi:hypothetical protein
MTINSDRYLRLTGISFLVLLLWIGGMTMITIDFDFLGVVLIITMGILAFITMFFLLYLVAIIDPKEEDEFADNFNKLKDFLTLKNILVAGIVFALGKVYWFISSHINFQTKKHVGYEFLGGKRKGSTHRKKH